MGTIAEIAARVGCKEHRVKYLIRQGVIVGARSQPKSKHKRKRRRVGQAQTDQLPTDTLTRVSIASAILDAGGNLDSAAFALLLRGKLCPDMRWTRRALLYYLRLQENGDDKRHTPVYTLRDEHGVVKRYPVKLRSGMPAAWHGMFPDVSLPTLRRLIDAAPVEDLPRIYHDARRIIHHERRTIEQALSVTLYRAGNRLTRTVVKAAFLGDYLYADNVSDFYILVPLFMLVLLVEPNREKLWQLATFMGQDRLAGYLATQNDTRAWAIAALPEAVSL